MVYSKATHSIFYAAMCMFAITHDLNVFIFLDFYLFQMENGEIENKSLFFPADVLLVSVSTTPPPLPSCKSEHCYLNTLFFL